MYPLWLCFAVPILLVIFYAGFGQLVSIALMKTEDAITRRQNSKITKVHAHDW